MKHDPRSFERLLHEADRLAASLEPLLATDRAPGMAELAGRACVAVGELLLAAGPSGALRAVRLLRAALDEAASSAARRAPASTALLRIAPDGGWFETPDGNRVSLARRAALRRVLARLVDEQARAPGAALDVAELARAGWPSGPELAARASRVHVAVARLRALGLGGALQGWDRGYRLDPRLCVLSEE